MRSMLSKGRNLTVPAITTAVVGGQAVKYGSLFGIIEADTAVGDDAVLVRNGVFSDQPKDTAAAWTFGDVIYWDDTAKKFTKTATNNLRVGYAVAAALQADTMGTVVLGVDTV
ncbi:MULTISPECIES: DUF2190 family protein [unclassified Bradyrhizobium]|uniref:DUF2190 family protein n=1 Tax=unclassified Bradyrhizobium TaxID=2631580 RepID=UPI0029160FBC|nr:MULTISPECIES: DUF2190 family protein [unclassified Bradyrhizobium]